MNSNTNSAIKPPVKPVSPRAMIQQDERQRRQNWKLQRALNALENHRLWYGVNNDEEPANESHFIDSVSAQPIIEPTPARDNRIDKNLSAVKERRARIRAKNTNSHGESNKKNTNSHGKRKSKKGLQNRCMRRAIKDAIYNERMKSCRGASNSGNSNNTSPSYHIPTLINSLPKTVVESIDENDNDIQTKLNPPAWRDLDSDRVKPYFYQLALSEQEKNSGNQYQLTPFVFNESTALTAAINSQKLDRVDFIRDRLQKLLNEALQRPKCNQVAFWFAFETAFRGQPHYQGSLLIRPDEEKRVRDAIYKLNRQMTEREKHGCLRFRYNRRLELFATHGNLYTDLNWADYNLKEIGITRREYNNLKKIVAVSQPLTRFTEDYYNRFRSAFKGKSLEPVNKNPIYGSW